MRRPSGGSTTATRSGAMLALALLARAAALSPPVCGTASAPAEAAALAAADAALVPSRSRASRPASRGSRTATATNFGTNPDGVYLAYFLDADAALPRRHVRRNRDPMGPLCSGMFTRASANETSMFVLGPADAVAFYGCTPPAVRYFRVGRRPRVAARADGQPQHDVGTNSATRSTTCARTPSSRVDGEVLVVHTADGDAARAVADGFEAAGASRAAARTRSARRSCASSTARRAPAAWPAVAPDVLLALLRASVPANRTALDEWAALEWPVRPTASDDAAAAPLAPAPAPRETASTRSPRSRTRSSLSAPSSRGGTRARRATPTTRGPATTTAARARSVRPARARARLLHARALVRVERLLGRRRERRGLHARRHRHVRRRARADRRRVVRLGRRRLLPARAQHRADRRRERAAVPVERLAQRRRRDVRVDRRDRDRRRGRPARVPRARARARSRSRRLASTTTPTTTRASRTSAPGVMAQSKASLGFYDDWLSVLAMARDTSVVGTRTRCTASRPRCCRSSTAARSSSSA